MSSTNVRTIKTITFYSDDTYDAIISSFRSQVPPLDIARMRAATNDKEIKQAVEAACSPSGFVLFADYNHAGWMRHFGHQSRAHRFTIGNPLFALPVLQHDIDVALHIPLDCCFVEELKVKRTKMIFTLPTTLVDGDCKEIVGIVEIEEKLLALARVIMQQA